MLNSLCFILDRVNELCFDLGALDLPWIKVLLPRYNWIDWYQIRFIYGMSQRHVE
jgi:hypothetical protein